MQFSDSLSTGRLSTVCGRQLPLQVLKSAAGYYIGTADEDGPFTRESIEYWPSADLAADALRNGTWTQKGTL